MSIVCKCEFGWLVDHQRSINSAYENTLLSSDAKSSSSCQDAMSHSDNKRLNSHVVDETRSDFKTRNLKSLDDASCAGYPRLNETTSSDGSIPVASRHAQFRCREELFAIYQPFLMDSEFEKLNRFQPNILSLEKDDPILGSCNTEEHCASFITNLNCAASKKPKSCKKRKRKQELNNGELCLIERHQEIRPIVLKALEQLKSISENYFNVATAQTDNNISARLMSKLRREPSLGEFVQSSARKINNSNELDSNSLSYFDQVIHSEIAITCHFFGSTYLFPTKSTFLMSDISHIDRILTDRWHSDQRFDCIVIDPPWRNKSVKRKKTYDTLSEWDLLQLPIKKLANENALIVVWTTNKEKQQEFVRHNLFTTWDCTLVAQWYWLKVTRTGVPVYEMNRDDLFKRPYESVLIARVKSSLSSSSDRNVSEGIPVKSCNGRDVHLVPDCQVIVSVPCSIHSRKPPLNEILEPFLPSDARCLELFARNLLPGWTSWGNEVLEFQRIDYFQECQETTPQFCEPRSPVT